ncbi:hypothetical protein A2U01_0028131, partial [Trifolium medium]|nr:hypothetical protein [Trifolium medium]
MSNSVESSPLKEQITATSSKARSTRSKSKEEGSAIIANATPITTVHASDAKKENKVKICCEEGEIHKTTGVKSNVDTSVKDLKMSDVEASENVVADTKTLESEKSNPIVTLIPENPKSAENLGQTEWNVVDSTNATVDKTGVDCDAVISPT